MVQIAKVEYVNSYEERLNDANGACHQVTNLPHSCNAHWPRICSSNGANKEQNSWPSLFSDLKVQASFPDAILRQNEAKLKHERLTLTMYLSARLCVLITNGIGLTSDKNVPTLRLIDAPSTPVT